MNQLPLVGIDLSGITAWLENRPWLLLLILAVIVIVIAARYRATRYGYDGSWNTSEKVDELIDLEKGK